MAVADGLYEAFDPETQAGYIFIHHGRSGSYAVPP
jgi:hypothetical protein